MKKLSLLAFCSLVLAGFAVADDWPQWRGPHRDDVSRETGLLKTWPKDGPKLLWTIRDAGIGYSSVAVVGDTLYSMGADDKRVESLYAIDLKTQEKKWSTPLGPQHDLDHGDGPRGTPAVDGDLVYGIGSQGILICVKASNGERVWFKKFQRSDEPKGEDLGGQMMSGWGYSESPLVDGNQVVCTPGGKKGAMAAFDKKTGELIWRSKEWVDSAGYSSIVPADIGGVHQYVQLTGESVAGIDARDGKLLWRYKRSGSTAVVPTPIVSDGYVFITSGYGAGCSLIKIKHDDKGGFEVKEVAKNQNMTNHHGGVVLVDGYVYGYDDNKGLVCLDFKTTDVKWHHRSDHGKMSVTAAEGQLYWYGAKDGEVLLVEATPKEYVQHGAFAIPEKTKVNRRGGEIWTHPVVANGKLYLRDQDLLFCYDVKAH